MALSYQQTRRLQQPRGPQVRRHLHQTLVTGDAVAAAWLMTFPLAGAAIDDGAAVNPTPMAIRAAKAIFFMVPPSLRFGPL
jgi:hypothetical protein